MVDPTRLGLISLIEVYLVMAVMTCFGAETTGTLADSNTRRTTSLVSFCSSRSKIASSTVIQRRESASV